VESQIIILAPSSALAKSPFLSRTTVLISLECPYRVKEFQNKVVGVVVVVVAVVVVVVVVVVQY
jgi:hypothetical protein